MTADLHADFLQKIQASEGDALRLAQSIYSDWLEEQGDPRAELLRLAVQVRDWSPHRQVTPTEDPQAIGRQYYRGVIEILTDEDATLWLWATSAKFPIVEVDHRGNWIYWPRGTKKHPPHP